MCLPSTLKQSPMHGAGGCVECCRVDHGNTALSSGNHCHLGETLRLNGYYQYMSKKRSRLHGGKRELSPTIS